MVYPHLAGRRLVRDGRLVAVPSPDEMGDSLVEYLKPNLLERGGLAEKPVVCRTQPDTTARAGPDRVEWSVNLRTAREPMTGA